MIRSATELWRRRALLWAPALAFFVLAAGALGLYHARFAGEAEISERALERARGALAELTAERRALERDLERIRTNRTALASFYGQRLATESERLTRVIAEVKDLAERSGLSPGAISYPDERLEGFGLRRRSFVFAVQGSYSDLRRLINLLELSPSFLTLEEVRLNEGGGGGRLGISLRLSTLFAAEDAEPLGGAPMPVPAEENGAPVALEEETGAAPEAEPEVEAAEPAVAEAPAIPEEEVER